MGALCIQPDNTPCFWRPATWIQSHGKKTQVRVKESIPVFPAAGPSAVFSGISSSTWVCIGLQTYARRVMWRLASAIRIQMQNGYRTRTEGGSKYLILQSSACSSSDLSKISDSFGLRDWIPIAKKLDSSPYTALGGEW